MSRAVLIPACQPSGRLSSMNYRNKDLPTEQRIKKNSAVLDFTAQLPHLFTLLRVETYILPK